MKWILKFIIGRNKNGKGSYSFIEENYNAGSCGSGHTLTEDIPQGDPKYDAARANMGGTPWMMFTKDQGQELIDNTTNEWVNIGNKYGRKFTSKTDSSKYIFLPAAGWWGIRWGDDMSLHGAGESGRYWSTTFPSPRSPWEMSFGQNHLGNIYISFGNGDRELGISIRAIAPKTW